MNETTIRGRDLIDAYLLELTRTLRGQPDAEDLIAELADHLCESVDVAVARGSEPTIAQQVAIARLGQPALVARALVSARARKLAQPSGFTVLAGRVGGAAAVLWIAVGLAQFLASEAVLGLFDARFEELIYAVVMSAILATGLLILGVSLRSGGRRDIPTLSVALCVVLALVVGAGEQWAFMVWGGLLSLAAFMANRQRIQVAMGAPSMIVVALAWPIGTGVVQLGQLLLWGPAGLHADYPLAVSTGLAVACALSAIGCAINARWLAAEKVPGSELLTA